MDSFGAFQFCQVSSGKDWGCRLLSLAKVIDDCSHSDLKSSGHHWSWHSSVGTRRILVRLARILSNEAWLDLLSQSYYVYRSQASTDHSPMLLNLLSKFNRGSKPFKFLSYWKRYLGYKELIACKWNTHFHGSPLFKVVMKLKTLKLALREWTKANNISPSKRLKEIRDKLDRVYDKLDISTLDDNVHQEEVSLNKELNQWLLHEEDQFRQKSREL